MPSFASSLVFRLGTGPMRTSVQASMAARKATLAAGADRFLDKSKVIEGLGPIVREVLRGDREADGDRSLEDLDGGVGTPMRLPTPLIGPPKGCRWAHGRPGL